MRGGRSAARVCEHEAPNAAPDTTAWIAPPPLSRLGRENGGLARKGHHADEESEASRSSSCQHFVQQIPEELLDQILSCTVRGHADLRNISLTCKKWLAFATQETQWKRLCIRGWGHRSDIIQVPLDKDVMMAWKEYYKRRLDTHLPELSYMRHQQQMTVSIRSILINWLLAVIDEFQQEDEAFFPGVHHQTVATFDQYCSSVRTSIQTNELQMIGAACVVMALHTSYKVDEIDMEYFNKASFYTDGACTAQQVMDVARQITESFPGKVLTFFEAASDHIETLLTTMQKNYPSSSTFCLAHYLGELALQAEASLKYTSIEIGASAYALACHTLGWAESLWMPIIKTHFRELSIYDLMPCMSDLQALLKQALSMLTRRNNKKVPLPHVIVKYSQRERQHVAKVIVTPSAWPIICPHGCHREEDEECMECCEIPDEDRPTVVMDEALVNEDTQPATEVVNEGETVAAVDDDVVEDIEEPAQIAAGERVPVGATPREISLAQRNEAHTPVNSVYGEAASPVSLLSERPAASGAALGGSMVLEGGSSSLIEAQGGSHKKEPAGLQDVSFGIMSENNDNSFGNSIADTSMEIMFEDRRASLGYNRRESIGSVLGAVLEEKEPKGDRSTAAPGRQSEGPLLLTRAVGVDATESSLAGDVSGHWGDTSRVEHVEDEQVVEVEVGVSDISINSDDEDDCSGSVYDSSNVLSSALLNRSTSY